MTHSAHTAYIRRDRGREQEYSEHSTAHTEQHTQHVAFLCPNIFVLVNIQWRSVYKHTYLHTHTVEHMKLRIGLYKYVDVAI